MKKFRTIDTLNGKGKVFSGETLIAEVSYSIEIKEEYVTNVASSGAAVETVIFDTHAMGTLSPPTELLKKEYPPLVLQLADGRKWRFIVAHPPVGTVTGLEVNFGPIRFAEIREAASS
jgi:hypothetical protein